MRNDMCINRVNIDISAREEWKTKICYADPT